MQLLGSRCQWSAQRRSLFLGSRWCSLLRQSSEPLSSLYANYCGSGAIRNITVHRLVSVPCSSCEQCLQWRSNTSCDMLGERESCSHSGTCSWVNLWHILERGMSMVACSNATRCEEADHHWRRRVICSGWPPTAPTNRPMWRQGHGCIEKTEPHRFCGGILVILSAI